MCSKTETLQRIKDKAKSLAALMRRVQEDKRFVWYKRSLWIISLAWAGFALAQSVQYYHYMGQAKAAQANGQYVRSEELYRLAKKEVEGSLVYKMIGDRDSRRIAVLNNLAELHRTQANYKESEREFAMVRDLAERVLGKRSEGYALSLNNLALLLRDEGRLAESEQMYKQAIDCWRYDLNRGKDAKCAASLNGLGKVYRDEGRYAEAEAAYQEALAIRGKTFGTESGESAEVLANLGTVYRDQGYLNKAESVSQKALAIDTKIFGAEHPYTATDMQNLAAVYRLEGKYREAEELYKQTMSIRQRTLGLNHPLVAKTLLGLAENYRLQKNKVMAYECWQRAEAIDKKAFPSKVHPDYATVCNTAAGCCLAAGDLVQAKRWIDEAIRIRTQLLSADHPDLAESYYEKGVILCRMGDAKGGLAALSRAAQSQGRSLGAQHKALALTKQAMGEQLRLLGRRQEADKLSREAASVLNAADKGA